MLKKPSLSSVQETLFFCAVIVLETDNCMFSTAVPLSVNQSAGETVYALFVAS